MSYEESALDDGALPPLPRVDNIERDYDVQTMLGRGTFGTVFRAVRRRDRLLVAMKVLRSGVLAQRLDDARELAMLRHVRRRRVNAAQDGYTELGEDAAQCLSNVACFVSAFVWTPQDSAADGVNEMNRLVRAWQDDNPEFRDEARLFDVGVEYTVIVTEFVPGQDMRDLIANEIAPTPEGRRDVTVTALRGLEQLHDVAGVAHNDIKPDNIRVTDDADAVLVDLGLGCVRYPVSEALGIGIPLPCADVAYDRMGTAFYTPPELARALLEGVPVDTDARMKGDVWSLGLSLLELFGGSLDELSRMQGYDTSAVLKALANYTTVITDEQARAWMPDDPRLAELVAGMVHPDPEQRPTAAQALAWLDQPPVEVSVMESGGAGAAAGGAPSATGSSVTMAGPGGERQFVTSSTCTCSTGSAQSASRTPGRTQHTCVCRNTVSP